MAGRVPEHVIRDIVRRADIVRLVGRYTRLQEKGKKHWGRCPFHREKTPSFSVEPDEGLYYCFGCKEGGNIFTFLKKMEGLEFVEALDQLAGEAGIDLSQFFGQPDEAGKSETGTLRQINELAVVFYRKCLEKARGSDTARDYLAKRKISSESAEKWRLGYAPDGWENLVNLVRRRGIDLNTVEQAGLILPREGGDSYYDRFRNRLIFPVFDRHGATIGFGARILGEQERDAKYLNSPETPIFSKGSCFYGLHHARSAIRRSSTAVVVEGYTDVIMAHQHGIENVVAVLGTALTESHALILSRLCEKVILVFDPDTAGRESAEKSIGTLLGSDVEPEVALLPEGQDPCDFLTARGREAFVKLLSGSRDFIVFCMEKAGSEHDLTRREQRTHVFQKLARMAARMPNEVKRDMLLRDIADEFGIAPQKAFDHLGRLLRQGRPANAGSGGEDSAAEIYSAEETFLSEMLTFLLVNPEYQEKAAERFDRDLFEETPHRRLLELILDRCSSEGPVQESEFLYMLKDPEDVSRVRDAVEKEKRYAAGDTEKRHLAYMRYMERMQSRSLHQFRKDEMDEQRLKEYVEMRRREERR